jgi:hypothetical protein
MRRRQDKGSILEMKERVPERLDTACLFPEFDRTQRRKVKFLTPDRVHLFPYYGGRLVQRPQPERQERIHTRRKSPDHSCTDHELVTGDDGICRCLFDGRDKSSAQTHGKRSAIGNGKRRLTLKDRKE